MSEARGVDPGPYHDVTFDGLVAQAASLSERLLAGRLMMATAESCTGGLIGAVCTSLAGSSVWYERGFITYSNEAKTELIGVPAELIRAHGAVSREVAEAMVQGALAHSRAGVAVAVTGIAGPGGATPGKPVGTVWLAAACAGQAARSELRVFPGGRAAVRMHTVQRALQMVGEALA